jgi:hypothetical protein
MQHRKSSKTLIKHFFGTVALLGAMVLATNCATPTVEEILEYSEPVSTVKKGIFVNFSGEGGTPASQLFNLVYKVVPKLEFYPPYTNEADFLAAHELDSYDYENDPLKLGSNEAAGSTDANNTEFAGEFKLLEMDLVYALENIDALNIPDRTAQGFVFSKWQIKAVDSRLGSFFKVGDDVADPAAFTFALNRDSASGGGALPIKSNGAYITVKALYVIDEGMAQKIADLQDLINYFTMDSVNAAEYECEYDDEFLIGNGFASDDTPDIAAKRAELQEAIDRANMLQGGEFETVDVPVDAFTLDENGDPVLDENGAQIPVIETVSYIAYNVPEITEVLATLERMKADPLYYFPDMVPKSLIIPADEAMHSVTIASTGDYEIDLYGASGGHMWSRNDLTALGGKGGHVKGIVRLNKGDVLKFRVGAAGEGTADYDAANNQFMWNEVNRWKEKKGGYNGGGNGGAGASPQDLCGSGGGGATDVRYVGVYQKDVTNMQNAQGTLEQRILVAGGGGGAAQSAWIANVTWPGLRGGDAGKPGVRRGPNFSTEKTYTHDGKTVNKTASIIAKGSTYFYGLCDGEMQPGVNANGVGTKGVKGNYSEGGCEGRGGGGGGYFGGGAVTVNKGLADQDNTASGGGGSNYLDITRFTQTDKNINDLADYFGNGKASIRFVD